MSHHILSLRTLRLVVWHRDGCRRLEDCGDFPVIRVRAGVKGTAPEFVAAAREQLRLDVAVVRCPRPDLLEVELLDADEPLPGGLRWRDATMVPAAEERHPWQRPGWYGTMLPAIDAALGQAGRRRVGLPVQFRHTSLTAILRVSTDLEPVWIKVVPPIFDHEGVVVGWLSRLVPRQVPRVVGCGPQWWMSADFPPEDSATAPRGDFLQTLAQVQMQASSRLGELRKLGCAERPLSRLAHDVEAAAVHDGPLDRADRTKLAASLGQLDKLCREADALGLPGTLVHGDLNRENARWTRQGWFLYDWTDCCIGNPLVDLERSLCDENATTRAARALSFARAWQQWGLGADTSRALALAPALGAAHQVASYRWILDGIRSPGFDISGRDRLEFLLRYWARRLVALL